MTTGFSRMVRASLVPSISSWSQAATYQQFFRKMPSVLAVVMPVLLVGGSMSLGHARGRVNRVRSNTLFESQDNHPAMYWDDYDVFCHVIEHGGFTAAARAMQRTKSGVSASIA